jgi:hypothetical protein
MVGADVKNGYFEASDELQEVFWDQLAIVLSSSDSQEREMAVSTLVEIVQPGSGEYFPWVKGG